MNALVTPFETHRHMTFPALSEEGGETNFNLRELLEAGAWRTGTSPTPREIDTLITLLHACAHTRDACYRLICEWRSACQIPNADYR